MATLANIIRGDYTVGGIPLQTTGASATTLCNVELPNPGVYWIEVKVVATKSDHSAGASYWRQKCVRIDNTNTAYEVPTSGTRTVVTDNEDTSGWDVALTLLGTDLRGTGTSDNVVAVRVTGAAATTINWMAYPTITRVV